MAAHPTRFRGFASLPTPDPVAAAVEELGAESTFLLMRADGMLAPVRSGLRSVAQVVPEHIQITICGYATLPPFQSALSAFGPDRIPFSVDYPWGDPVTHAQFLREAPISADKEKIAHLNAERLLRCG